MLARFPDRLIRLSTDRERQSLRLSLEQSMHLTFAYLSAHPEYQTVAITAGRQPSYLQALSQTQQGLYWRKILALASCLGTRVGMRSVNNMDHLRAYSISLIMDTAQPLIYAKTSLQASYTTTAPTIMRGE